MQSNEFEWEGFRIDDLIISWKAVQLILKKPFTTAHYSSETRINFFFRINHENKLQKGFGECGLPPKKKNCYLADFNDCKYFAESLRDKLEKNQTNVTNEQLNLFKIKLFQNIPQKYFRYFYEQNLDSEESRKLVRTILLALYWGYQIIQPHFKAALCALQFALFDYFAKTMKMSLTHFIFLPQEYQNSDSYSFATLSYQQDIQKMTQNALEFLEFSSYIKIKYIDRIPNLIKLLIQIQKASQNRVQGYIIDANASWKVESMKQFNGIISNYEEICRKIMYIEQPFPIEMDYAEYEQWKQLKNQSKIKIMSDESFSSFEKVQQSLNLAHAINIKSQKVGGPINCIKSALSAQKYKLEVMIGSMVTTHHGSNQNYSLYPLTKWLDIDGSLLVLEPALQGGFQWGGILPLKKPKTKYFGIEIDTSKVE